MKKLYNPKKITVVEYNALKALYNFILIYLRPVAEKYPGSIYAQKYDKILEALEKLETKEIID